MTLYANHMVFCCKALVWLMLTIESEPSVAGNWLSGVIKQLRGPNFTQLWPPSSGQCRHFTREWPSEKFQLTTYPPLVHAVIECPLLHNEVKHFRVFLFSCNCVLTRYLWIIRIGIIKFVKTVMIRIIFRKYFIQLSCFLLLLQVTAYWPYFYMVWRGFDVETSSEFRRKLSHKNAIKLEFGQEGVSFLERLLSADQLPV